jgi:hypothetical protein
MDEEQKKKLHLYFIVPVKWTSDIQYDTSSGENLKKQNSNFKK